MMINPITAAVTKTKATPPALTTAREASTNASRDRRGSGT